MNLYEKEVYRELNIWIKGIYRKANSIQKLSKAAQTKIQGMMPSKVNKILTDGIKHMTKTIMFGSLSLTNLENTMHLTLSERDFLVMEKFKMYQKVATAQGAGFGAGGILLSAADFPALLSIKMKFLFDCANIYGFNVDSKEERLYILYVFQLAFSDDNHRQEVFYKISHWEETKREMNDIDWEKFQVEYRDYIDLVKLLQIIPVAGIAFGAAANYTLLERLRENAMNCYRMRILKITE